MNTDDTALNWRDQTDFILRLVFVTIITLVLMWLIAYSKIPKMLTGNINTDWQLLLEGFCILGVFSFLTCDFLARDNMTETLFKKFLKKIRWTK